MSQLAWRSHLRPILAAEDQLVLLSENGHQLFSGHAYVEVAQWLSGDNSDGSRPDGDVSFEFQLALNHLQALGVLCDDEAESSVAWLPGEVAYWHTLQVTAVEAQQQFKKRPIAVCSTGSADVDQLIGALTAAHVKITEQPADRLVVVVEDYQHPELSGINRSCLDQSISWLPVKLVGAIIWLGPLFVPGRTACWACLDQRLRLNRQAENVLAKVIGEYVSVPTPSAEWAVELAANFAAAEISRWLVTGDDHGLEDCVLTFDLKSGELCRHSVTRRPQCRECGVPRRRAGMLQRHTERGAGAVHFGDAPKSNSADGRRWTPDFILHQFEHHVSPITGVIHSLDETTTQGIRQVVAPHAFPLHRYDFLALRDNYLGRSGGKGLTGAAGRASAVCEALERISGIWNGDEETLVAAQGQLDDRAVDLNQCLGFSSCQLADRDRWNAANDDVHLWIPRPLPADLEIAWTQVWSLTQNRSRLLPAAYCYYGHPDLALGFTFADSNGCAAGATLAEAAVFGLLELIERDAAAMWWFNRVGRPALDLNDFQTPLLGQLQEFYQQRQRPFWVIDLTNDLGVPVMAAVSARRDHPSQDVIYGFGADFDVVTAVERAVLEMNQSFCLIGDCEIGRDAKYRTNCSATLRWLRTATTENQSYLLPDADQPTRRRSDFEGVRTTDWREDLDRAVSTLANCGLETLILDQTRPDIGLPVCRVIVPGMCHIWRRFGAVRLREVPFRLGWTDYPKPIGELNEFSVYF